MQMVSSPDRRISGWLSRTDNSVVPGTVRRGTHPHSCSRLVSRQICNQNIEISVKVVDYARGVQIGIGRRMKTLFTRYLILSSVHCSSHMKLFWFHVISVLERSSDAR